MEPEAPAPLAPESSSVQEVIAQRLLDARTVVVSGEVNQALAGRVIAQLTALAALSADPITLIINSQGGHVESGDTIHDYIRFIEPPVRMLGTGWVASAGALIYVAAELEHRFCLPNTRFLLHQPAGGVRGTTSDIAIEAEQILQMRDRINRLFARATGQPVERIERDTNRNFWLSAEDAVAYGLVGKIVERASEIGPSPPRSDGPGR